MEPLNPLLEPLGARCRAPGKVLYALLAVAGPRGASKVPEERLQGFRFWVWVLGFGFRVQGLHFGFRVYGLGPGFGEGFRVWGLGWFWVEHGSIDKRVHGWGASIRLLEGFGQKKMWIVPLCTCAAMAPASFPRVCHYPPQCALDCNIVLWSSNYIAIVTAPAIAARVAIMMSSCRLPSSLLAAGMPLEFRLTLDFMPADYEQQYDLFYASPRWTTTTPTYHATL